MKKEVKKIKLSMNDLKVQSFVTSLDVNQQENIKGGGSCQSGVCGTASCPVSYTNGMDNCC